MINRFMSILVATVAATMFNSAGAQTVVRQTASAPTSTKVTSGGRMSQAERFVLETRGISVRQTSARGDDTGSTQGSGCELTVEEMSCLGSGWEFASWDFYSGGFMQEISVAKLPRVEIEGQAFGPQEIVICIDTCQSVASLGYVDPGPYIAITGLQIWKSIIEWLLPTPRVSACGPATIGYGTARNGTSFDDMEQRQITANAILNASIPPTHRGPMNGKVIEVMFSDGGSELYKFAGAASVHPPAVPNELKRGTGVSKCPV